MKVLRGIMLRQISSKFNCFSNQLIKISFLNGTEGELVDDWLHILKTNKTNAKLRERAIEILHKTNRFEEAEKIIRETKNE